MYFLLFILHGIFIVLSHLLGYYLLEGVFFVFLLFFLLYFSPIFFSKKDQNFPALSFSSISFSIQDSLILPMLFFYAAIYFLLFAVTRDFFESFTFNTIFFIIIYVIFFLYMMAFEWKNEMFFDIARIHMIFSYAILFSVVFLSFFFPQIITLTVLGLISISLLFSVFYFSHARREDILFFQGFLFSIMILGYIVSVIITGVISYSFIIFSFGITAILLFELMPRHAFFEPFLPLSKIYMLIAFLFSYFASIVWAFFDTMYYPFILVGIVFLFLIHIRFSNYIALSGAVFWTFFLYSIIFFSLMSVGSLLSTLLFIFFLPLCIIGNTYFWEERFPYDLKVLHYSSIAFSLIFTVYAIIFIPWWSIILFVFALSLFLLGFLLFLSYFRFRSH